MKKSLIFAGMLVVGFANAQTDTEHLGKVGINTMAPKATLEIQPTTTNLTGTTNEGIIAPKLSKERIAAITTPVEGTMVYATDATYTGSDSKVAKITEKGYYFYNGTEWVKSGVGANDQLWAQRDNSGITETYLKPALGDGNNYYLSGKGSTLLLGNIDENETWETGNTLAYKFDEIPNFVGINSSKFKKSNTGANGDYNFSHDSYQLFGVDAINGTGKSYVGKVLSTVVQSDVANNLRSVAGLNTSISHKGNSKVNYLSGLDIYTYMGTTHNGNIPEAISNIAAGFNPRILKGKVDNLVGIWTYPRIYGGDIKNVVGSDMLVNTGEVLSGVTATLPTMNYTQVIGYRVDVNNKMNTTTAHLAGADFFTGYENGSTAGYGYALIGRAEVKEGAVLNNYHGVVSYLKATGAANVENVYGFKHSVDFSDTFKPNNEFGLWIDNVDNGQNSNYSIYTNAGAVRFGDLAGTNNRPVFADADGKLIIGDATNAATSFKWVEDATNTSVKLAVTSAGVERTDNPVSITDTGMVKATSFQGTNGATIFPDYVFQKYYTGNSSIKADYTFKSLSQVEDFVKTNGHLPGYKSAEAIKAQGYVDLMETQLTNVEKIEELYLHTIELKKENEELKARLEKLEKLLK